VDKRLRKLWGAWATEPVPENAQAYCEHLQRVNVTDDTELTLGAVDLDCWCAARRFGSSMPWKLQRTFRLAFDCYAAERHAELGNYSKATFEEVARLFSRAHFVIMEGVGDRTADAIHALLEDHGEVLRRGKPAQAWNDLNRGSTAALIPEVVNDENRILDAENTRLTRALARTTGQLHKARADNARLKRVKKKNSTPWGQQSLLEGGSGTEG
jgi:hypothetical protein